MAQIEIDGKQLTVPDGSTIIDAADSNGIYIPRFCYHKKLSVAANCRMCLVQVEKAAKPLPACATPVTDGMKVMTRSPAAIKAQKGVMEFLLINHPLDCPICDQGGECQLQDLSVGYGGVASRYQETKRVVLNKNLGPLVATDMTRCINCTRCVRFGQEIAGIMELGQAGRGEHAEIMPFVERTVNSELSGNMIDLCPVGALTSKPFRYTARPWELARRPSVSPHDSLGANIVVQTKQNKVFRVLPRDNEEVNECWVSDRDRFSYEGLNSPERLTKPMVKLDGQWRETEWQFALEHVVAGLKRAKDEFGVGEIATLANPGSTLEELHLLQKLVRGLGVENIDHRVRQSDFSRTQGAPWLGQSIASLSELTRILVIGSTLRKENPLLAHRLRQAVKRGAQLNVVNCTDDDLLVKVAGKVIAGPAALADALAQVVKAVAEAKQAQIPADVAGVEVGEAARKIAASLASGTQGAVLLGNLAVHHPQYSRLHALAQTIAELTGAKLGLLGEAANSVGAHLVNFLPGNGGANAGQMFAQPRRAYLLFNLEAELDTYNGQQAVAALKSAGLVVSFTAFKSAAAMEYADVLLPIAPFSETAGTYVNAEGRVQSFNAAVKALGDARPGWKVLRVLGNLFEFDGFRYESADEIRVEALGGASVESRLNNRLGTVSANAVAASGSLQRIGEVPIYSSDAIVRRAPALQRTADAADPVAAMHEETLASLKVSAGDTVVVRQGSGSVQLKAVKDNGVARNSVRVAASHPATAVLGGMLDEISVERLA